ncbi:MAG: TfoX/Sxy family protein [Pseudomonadota bacterium]
MAVSAEYKDFIEELLSDFGPVKIRAMFGGAGVYADDVMFALIADETLYLKADDAFSERLRDEGSEPFEYVNPKTGKAMQMSYWRLPELAADTPEDACRLARMAYDVALKAKKPKRKSPKRP